MKLSDAIRKGAEETKQVYGMIFGINKLSQKVEYSCALGAAVVGMGKTEEFFGCSTTQIGEELHPILIMNTRELPEELKSHLDIQDLLMGHPTGEASIYYVVWNLNDSYSWSRKAIAEWIGTIEDYLGNDKMTEDEKRISIEENENCLQEYTH